MPTGGEWTPLKNDATRFVKETGKATPQSLLSDYVSAMGGPASFSSSSGGDGGGTGGGGGGSGGGSGGGGSTRAARRVTQSLGNFLSRVGTAGLDVALQEIGLGDLVGKPAIQIARALLDKLAGPASTIDDAAARAACDDLIKELFQDARNDLDRVLKAALDARGLGGLLMRFFSLYIYRRFCRDFYENWKARVTPEKANARLGAIKKYIDTQLKARCVNKDISAVNWSGGEGGRLVSQILGQTCRVFQVQGEG